ncbi:archease [Sulfolobus sp. A20]|uniref:archease n=1 Tax=Sulfolobaceae TaxID=118883 RepID=UPI000845F279|nr:MULTISPECIES: archease [unclassified Sulfolobus]TRM74148.1 archease [Sulfolobus sp. E5]TRM74954.1 archease [Sulfolobus sp. A20-N-F8]TRM75216.1 archease [Sulfolobus sp. B5]TRM80472.1 archease [Sulfolobus sp. D5]TRM87119.1 archease [Sulfolobus sp. C3]TRM94866.1 archease [Sulfolobus sp. A20-N-G8]TRN01785.1 archease [Sulfolobus sp. E1]TRN02528.1 archease [Sulfolobus sp. F1]
MNPYEFFDHTADIGIRAYGNSLEEAFSNAALAVFEIMTDTTKVQPLEYREVFLNGYDLENLLYKWIEELLYYYDTELMLFSKFDIVINEENMVLQGKAWGERFNEAKHERRTLVKAMTYHEMSIQRSDNRFIITFVVDI